MSTKTRNILQGLFFILLAVFCFYAYTTGKTPSMKNFTLSGTIISFFVGIVFLKNGLKK